MKQYKFAVSIVLSLAAFLGATIACSLTETEERTNIFNHYYRIEPASLLEALETGETNVFFPLEEEPAYIPVDQQISVSWTQDDYLRIANALSGLIWNGNLDGWHLNSMLFITACAEDNAGFQDGNFRFFKNIEKNRRESRLVRIINIDPRNKYIFATENEYYPKLVNWSSIELGRTQLSAKDVLQIAEDTGGQEKRLAVGNSCDLSLLLSPDYASYNGWEVDYTRLDGTPLYHIQIDPITGEINSP